MIKKITSMFLACVLVFIMLPLSVPAAGSDITVSVKVTNMTDGDEKYLQLGLYVKATGYETFRSVGAVLEIDTNVLVPGAEYDMTEATSWDKAVTLKTQKPDDSYSAGARAYKAESGNKLYIEFQAEKLSAVEITGTEICVATLNLDYAEGKSSADVNLSQSEDDPTIRIPADYTVIYSSNLQHGIIYFNGTNTYYYRPLKDDGSGNVVKDDSIGDEYILTTNASTIFPQSTIPNVDVASISNPDDFATIVFYDWDNTLLGSIIVPKGEDATALVTEFENSLKSETFDEGSQYYSSNAEKPLTNKKGYSFEGVWLDYDSETLTHYGYAINPVSGAVTEIEKPEGVSFTDVQESMTLKAAYGSNDEIGSSGLAQRRYTAAITEYNRFGTTPNYSIKIQIKRENTSGGGAPRNGSLALRVIMTTTAGVNIYSLVTLENKDEVTAEVVPNVQIRSIQCNVIDTYGVSNWAAGATLRSGNLNETQGTLEEKKGFVFLGNMGYVNSALEPGGTLTNISRAILQNDLGLELVDSGGSSISDIGLLRGYLQSAWQAKNPGYDQTPAPEFVDLTWDEMQHAIKNSGALLTP